MVAPMEDSSRTSQALASSYLNVFYGVLFHPLDTFKTLAEGKEPDSRLLLYALLSVVVVSAAAPIIRFAAVGSKADTLAFAIPISSVMGVLAWVLVGLVIALLSYAFSGKIRYRTFLVLSGLSTLPWLLMAPISLLKAGLGLLGVILCAVFGLSVWLWAVLLFALAIVITYEMTADRVMIVLAAPFAMTLIFFGWVFGFLGNIVNLIPR
jgi:hypothetical protein